MTTDVVIRGEDLTASVAEALQLISFAHPADFIRHLTAAWRREESAPAKAAMTQMLVNSRMSLLGRRPICQDTGVVNVFVELGMACRIDSPSSLQDLIDEGVRRAWRASDNPLRASLVADPLFGRRNTGDNTPAIVHVDLVQGAGLKVTVAAKGGGSENKTRFAVLLPSDDVATWVVDQVATMGAGWCPPGMLGIGVGGTVEHAMLLAKQALMEPLDMSEIQARGPRTPLETMRADIHDRVNALGIGAQGLGGQTTVLDVKIRTAPTHAASLPVALIPNCAATRHVSFELDGSGPATFELPDARDWPDAVIEAADGTATRVNLDALTREQVAAWTPGQTLLLNGTLLSGRDAAHKRFADLIARGEDPPVSLEGKVIYYVGPVDAVRDEAVGPAGPTTASRMDPFMDVMLEKTGLLAAIGKGERGPGAIEAIKRHGAASLIAVGGAAYLVSKAVRSAKVIAFPDLGMEAVHAFEVVDMPVTVAVDARGESVHTTGPARWRRTLTSSAGPSGA